MVFTTDFKIKVFDTLQYNPYLLACMEALDKNSPGAFRLAIELALDEVKKGMEPRQLLDDGDRMLWNGMVKQWYALNKLYTEFMDMYISEMDKSRKTVNG